AGSPPGGSHRRSTVGAEVAAGRVLGVAGGTRRPAAHRVPAVGAELATRGFGPAVRALRRRGLARVHTGRPVLCVDLVPPLAQLRVRLQLRDLVLEPRRAVDALIGLVVPADLVAEPVAAAEALMERGHDCLGRLAQGPVLAGRVRESVELVRT